MDPVVETTQLLNSIGAELIRDHKHQIWRLPNGVKFTQSKTPSDHRASSNDLSTLRRLIRDSGIQIPGKPVQPPIAAPPTAHPGVWTQNVKEPEVMPFVEHPPAQPETPKGPRRSERVTVTPGLAVSWLELNTNNRPASPSRVEMYARDMTTGNWRYNHQAIIFGANNVLLDGQNRLKACVLSAQPFETDVVWDADPDVVRTIDQNRPRSISDQCVIEGMERPGSIATTARLLWRYENGTLLQRRATGISVPEMHVYTHRHREELLEAVRACDVVAKKVAPLSCMALCYILCRRKNPAKAAIFFENLKDGLNLDLDSPIYRLREKLIRLRSMKGMETRSEYLAALTIVAWNHYIRNSKLNRIYFPKDRNEFPEVLG